MKQYGVDREGKPIVQLNHPEILQCRNLLIAPCGVFRAAEETGSVIVTDAVAEAVVQAGCTGIELNEVHSAYSLKGPLRRRGINGAEPDPRTFL
jgi:hypothetical protein